MKMSRVTRGCKMKNIVSHLEEARKILRNGAFFRQGILKIAIAENIDRYLKDLQARRGLKTMTLPETHTGDPGLILYLTYKRKSRGTLDTEHTELIDMVAGSPQRPAQ